MAKAIRKKNRGFPAEAQGLVLLVHALLEDQHHALTLMVDGDRSPEARRVYVRAAMAFVEGATNAFKRVALAARGWKSDEPLFTRAEVALLREESYRVNRKGVAEIQSLFIPLGNNIKLALRTFAKAQERPTPNNYDGSGWGAMLDAIRIRNRLTHPHLLEDLNVSDDELRAVEKAVEWFQAETGKLYDVAAAEQLRSAPGAQ